MKRISLFPFTLKRLLLFCHLAIHFVIYTFALQGTSIQLLSKGRLSLGKVSTKLLDLKLLLFFNGNCKCLLSFILIRVPTSKEAHADISYYGNAVKFSSLHSRINFILWNVNRKYVILHKLQNHHTLYISTSTV